MVLVGIDPDNDTHTVVAVDQAGRQLDQRTVPARAWPLVSWARTRWPERTWAVEDCRHVTGRLERDLLAAGARVVGVPARLLAGARQAVGALGKSDPIDALAVARAARREPNLPTAGHDQTSWEVKLLVDHREHLVAERTRQIHRLRWQLQQLDPTWNTPQPDRRAGSSTPPAGRPTGPTLLSLPGCGPLTAAKLIAETAGVGRFRSEACFARPAGVARSRPAPAAPTATGCRVVATGSCMPPCTASPSPSCACPAQASYQRRRAQGDGTGEAVRARKRRIARAVSQRLRAAQLPATTFHTAAA